MNKKIFKSKFSSIYKTPNCSAADYVKSYLDGFDYEQDKVDSAISQANNVTDAFSRLIEILFDDNVLTKEQVILIVQGYALDDES